MVLFSGILFSGVSFPAFPELVRFMSDAIGDKLEALTSLAVVLAAMLAAYSLIRTTSMYIEGERNFGWSVARPILILFMVMEFPMVFNAFDSVVNVFTTRMGNTCKATLVDVLKTFVELPGMDEAKLDFSKPASSSGSAKKSEELTVPEMLALPDDNASQGTATPNWKGEGYIITDQQKANDDVPDGIQKQEPFKVDTSVLAPSKKSGWTKFTDWMTGIGEQLLKGIQGVGNNFKYGPSRIIITFAFLLMQIVFSVFQVLAAIYLSILKIFGPFIFALAIVNSWRGGIVSFLARYIQISLWVPIGNILLFFQLALARGIAQLAATNGGMGTVFIVIVLSIGVLASIFAIPKICSWFIESAGSANAQSALERGAGSVGRVIMK